jgi:hypothetical protein
MLARRSKPNPELGSRLFTYYMARASHGDARVDSGTHIRAALDACRKLGWPRESLWAYRDDGQRFALMPSALAFRDASDNRTKFGYHRVRTERGLKGALASGCPVVFGMEVSEAFVDGAFDPAVVLARMAGSTAGGHAMCAIGYDDDTVEIVNSWGRGWGNDGFFRADIGLVLDAGDIWAITH